jgi:hypothetical protein
MISGRTAPRTLHLLPSIPVAAAVGAAMGGPWLGLQAGLWCAAAVLNLALMARMVDRLSRGEGASPLGLALKLPLTLAAAWLGLQHSDVRAMILGLVAATSALLASALLSPAPPVTVR